MDIERIQASYQRISTVWRTDDELGRRIDRALLSDLLESLEELDLTPRVEIMTNRITDLFDEISSSLKG